MKRTEAVILREFRAAYSLLARDGHMLATETTKEEAARHRVALRDWIDDLTMELGRGVTEREAFDALYTHE